MKSLILLLFPALLQADLMVTGGHFVVAGGKVRELSSTTIQSDATLRLATGSEFITPSLHIETAGVLQGCGTVTGDVDNQGLILADCGTDKTLILDGDIENSGILRAENDTAFSVSGAFVNDGLIDLIFSPSSLPAGMTGSGQSVSATTLPPLTIEGDTTSLSIPAYPGHSYQLQFTNDLTATPVVWTNIGSAQTVNETTILTAAITLPTTGVNAYRFKIQD